MKKMLIILSTSFLMLGIILLTSFQEVKAQGLNTYPLENPSNTYEFQLVLNNTQNNTSQTRFIDLELEIDTYYRATEQSIHNIYTAIGQAFIHYTQSWNDSNLISFISENDTITKRIDNGEGNYNLKIKYPINYNDSLITTVGYIGGINENSTVIQDLSVGLSIETEKINNNPRTWYIESFLSYKVGEQDYYFVTTELEYTFGSSVNGPYYATNGFRIGQTISNDYNEGYGAGYTIGVHDGQLQGYDLGYEYGFGDGYNDGFYDGTLEQDTTYKGVFSIITNAIFSPIALIFGIEILPNISLGMIILVPLLFGLIAFVVGGKKK